MDNNLCACGCGESPSSTRSLFKQGHHMRVSLAERKALKKNWRPSLKCEWCGAAFSPSAPNWQRARFCTRQCARRARRASDGTAPEIIPCKHCGKEMSVTPWQAKKNKKFCSQSCRTKHAHAQWNQHSYLKNARRVYERRCYDCGWKEDVRLILIHHVDGDRSNGAKENLIPVCQNCHALRHLELDGRLPYITGLRWHGIDLSKTVPQEDIDEYQKDMEGISIIEVVDAE